MNHSSINGSAGMTPDTSMAQGNTYSDAWASLSPYSQSPYNNSPMNEYSHWNGYMPHHHHGLPSETLNRMPPPLPQGHQTHQIISSPQPHMGHHQLPMLNTTWPSQLTNPTPSGSYSAPPITMAPLASAQPIQSSPAETPKSAVPIEKPRRTLSVEQKRAMCQYAEDNPGVKQAEIGAKFGVERSTVSKVLTHKDQYLKRDQESSDPSAAKKLKGKYPDFDRTLSNYVKRQQSRGAEIKDEDILEQARLFARASDSQDSLMHNLTGPWLQKFKQRHGLGTGRLTRRASETNIPDSTRKSPARPKIKKEKSMGGISKSKAAKDRSSGIVSPASPTQLSPHSETRSEEDMQYHGLGLNISYRQAASQSTTSLNNTDAGNSSFSGSSAMSPTGNFTFSPDPNTGAFAFEHRVKRSNTFPSLNIGAIHDQNSVEPMTPRHPPSTTASSSALESPAQELPAGMFPLDTALTSPHTLHRSSSNSSMTGRLSTSTTVNPSSIDSSPVSPSQDDARRAATTLLNYIQTISSNGHGNFDQSEYMAIISLTKKLAVNQHPSRPSVGGLSRIPEGDSEMHAPHDMIMSMETG